MFLKNHDFYMYYFLRPFFMGDRNDSKTVSYAGVFSDRKLPISARQKKSMSYDVGNRQFPIRDFRRAIFDENPGGNASNFRQNFHRKSLGGNCLSLVAPHNIVLLVFNTTQYSMYVSSSI